MQNRKHIIELKKQLKQNKDIPFYSVIVFYGNCELKGISFVPNDTFIAKPKKVLEVIRLILIQNKPANYTNKHEIIKILGNAVQNGENSETQDQHIQNVRNILGKDRIFR